MLDEPKILNEVPVIPVKKKKPFGVCRKCKRIIENKLDSCRCRPYLCYHCCECGLDCELCSCSHKQRDHFL